jgi:tetratricopeptide (TPR) repeat protein
MEAYDVLYNAYTSFKKYDDGVEYGKESLHIAKETGNKKDEMFAHLLLGKIYLRTRQLSSSFLHINEGLNIAEELKHDEAKEKFTKELAGFYIFVGMHENADKCDLFEVTTCSEKDLVDDLEQAKKTKDKGKQIFSLFRLYYYYRSQHQYKQAIEILEQVKEVENNN